MTELFAYPGTKFLVLIPLVVYGELTEIHRDRHCPWEGGGYAL